MKELEEMEYDFEEEEELSEQEEIERKVETIKNMSNEDFQRLVYMTALDVSNKNQMFNENVESFLEKDEDERKIYIACAQKSALKSFSTNPDLVFSTLMRISKNTPEEFKRIILNQLLFDATYNEIFESYRLAEDKEKFFKKTDKNFGVDISEIALEEIDTEMAQEFFYKIEQEKGNFNHNDRIKQAINDYLIGLIKEEYPDLSKENEDIFIEKISPTINQEIENKGFGMGGFGPRGLNCDNQPSPELEHAFCSMDFGKDWPPYRMSAAAHLTFPLKMSIRIEKGKYAFVSNEYGYDSKYLYMTQEYKQQALSNINATIERELSKLPDDKKEEFEKEYQEELEKYNSERETLLKKKQLEDEILQKETQLQEIAETLMAQYSQKIEDIDKMDLPEVKKRQKRQIVVEETREALETYREYQEQRIAEVEKIKEEYGYVTVEMYDEEKGRVKDKDKWMAESIVKYSREEYEKIWDEFNKTPHEGFAWPKTDHLPSSDLNRYYAEKDRIESYEDVTNTQIRETEESTHICEEQKEILDAFAEAYCGYVTNNHSYHSRDYCEKEKNIEKLNEELKQYFTENSGIIQNNESMKEFEREILEKIAGKCGFEKERDIFRTYRDDSEVNVKFEDGIVIGKQSWSEKVYYGKIEDVDRKIRELESKKRFLEDISDKYGLNMQERSILESLKEYKNKMIGKERSLLELDDEKANLEEREQQARELLEQYNNQYISRKSIQLSDDGKINVGGRYER